MSNRLPNQLKQICGTSRPDRVHVAPVDLLPALREVPAPPDFIARNEVARAEYERAAQVLLANGLLKAATITLLAHYADMHSCIVAMREAGRVPRPTYMSALRQMAAACGLAHTTRDVVVSANPFAKFKHGGAE